MKRNIYSWAGHARAMIKLISLSGPYAEFELREADRIRFFLKSESAATNVEETACFCF